MNLNPHLHVPMPDGVWVPGPAGQRPAFVPTPAPTDQEAPQLIEEVAQRNERRYHGAIG